LKDRALSTSLVADLAATAAEHNMLIAGAAVLMAYVVRGFAGFGAGLLYMPVAAAVFGPKVAAATLLIFDLPGTIPFTVHTLPHAKPREVAPLVLGAAVTTPIGAYLLLNVDPVPMRWGLCTLIVLLLAVVASGWRYRRPVSDAGASLVGGASGVLNGLAQIGAPPLILFWLSRATAPQQMRADASLFFTLTTGISVATYLVAGLLTYEVLLRAIVLAPMTIVGLVLGNRLFGLASPLTYRRLAYGLVALAGIVGLPLFDGLLR
jgi:uncharacterized membrane protein YfcA